MSLSENNEVPKQPVAPAKEENPLMPKLSEPVVETKPLVASSQPKTIVPVEEEK